MNKFSLFPRGESAMQLNMHSFAKVSPLLAHTGLYSNVQKQSGSSSSSGWAGEGTSPMAAHSTVCIATATTTMANKLIKNLFIVNDLDCFFFDERVITV